MPREIWNVEWPNCNSQRKYPFAQDASLLSGDFRLPDDLIVDMVLPVNVSAAPDPTLFHLKQVGVFGAGITVSFAYADSVFATLSIPASGFVPYTTYALQGTGPLYDSRGWVTIGNIAATMSFPGAYTFDGDTGRLLPTVIWPRMQAVASITIVNGQDVGTPLTGDITLEAGRNFRLRVDTSGAQPVIYFDAISGEGTVTPCDCSDLDEDAPCIRTINGIAPTETGNFVLVGSDCIQLTPGSNQIELINPCAKPCCDCRELEVLSSVLENLQQQMLNMEMTAQRLDQEIQNTRGNLLASKTNGLPPS